MEETKIEKTEEQIRLENEQKMNELEEKRRLEKIEREEKDKAICEMISKADGRQIFNFMVKLKKGIGSEDGIGNSGKYMKLCYQRAKELNKDRYGNWEYAKVELNHMPEPQGIYKTESLLPVLGYPCEFVVSKEKTQLVLINPKLNIAYVRDLSTQVSFATAKKIFNS